MKKIGAVAEKIYFGIGAAAMGLLAVLVIFTVIMRYCFSMSWMLYDHIKPAVKRWVAVLNCFIMLAVDVMFVHYSWIYTQKMGKQISQGMEIPMSFMYGIMPVCGVICAIRIFIKLIQHVTSPLSAFEPKDKPLTDKQD